MLWLAVGNGHGKTWVQASWGADLEKQRPGPGRGPEWRVPWETDGREFMSPSAWCCPGSLVKVTGHGSFTLSSHLSRCSPPLVVGRRRQRVIKFWFGTRQGSPGSGLQADRDTSAAAWCKVMQRQAGPVGHVKLVMGCGRS